MRTQVVQIGMDMLDNQIRTTGSPDNGARRISGSEANGASGAADRSCGWTCIGVCR